MIQNSRNLRVTIFRSPPGLSCRFSVIPEAWIKPFMQRTWRQHIRVLVVLQKLRLGPWLGNLIRNDQLISPVLFILGIFIYGQLESDPNEMIFTVITYYLVFFISKSTSHWTQKKSCSFVARESGFGPRGWEPENGKEMWLSVYTMTWFQTISIFSAHLGIDDPN